MKEIQLGYGLASVRFTYEENQFQVLENESVTQRPLTDAEIGAAFDSPTGSPPLAEMLKPDDSVLIVVSDATRSTASAQIVNLLVRRLLQDGISVADIAIIFATGIHRAVTAQEKIDLLTSFIVQRVRTIDHNASDVARLTALGITEQGTVVELNSALQEFSRIVLIGGIGFHYFAGFTGGRKSVCPGLASARTIESTHMLAFDFEAGGRKRGVGTGILDGNMVHEECEKAAQMVAPAFGINTTVDTRGRAIGLTCGDWRLAHRSGCENYLNSHSVRIQARRDLVIVSCGGSPYDINLIQAHKALDMAAHACNEGGTLIILADCRDGLGRPDFMKWFDAADSLALQQRLRAAYEVNGQTAWSLLTKTERYRVCLVSQLPAEQVRQMRMIPFRALSDVLEQMTLDAAGYIMPHGAAFLPVVPS